MGLNSTEIIVVVLVALVMFGSKRIPTIMENLSKSINSLKKGLNDV